ncbi:hypothetical protein SPAN111604_06820 [Sphingomonas antarctica]|uniref:type II toxin-antitoxin system RelE/ParE family toxin n=1 Tax=Sphingomonas antarctica TaxID=2040274 RepID=UPI0039E754B3
MARVDVSAAARGDIDDIIGFSVERFGRDITDRYIAGLDELLGRLELYAELGSPYVDVAPPLRAISYRSHKLYYDYDGAIVTIVRVLHQSADASVALTN